MKAAGIEDELISWRLRSPVSATPSYVVLYCSRKVTRSTVTIVGRALFALAAASGTVVVRISVAVVVIVVGTCSTIVSTT